MDEAAPTTKDDEENKPPTKNLKNLNLLEEDKKIEIKEESEKQTD